MENTVQPKKDESSIKLLREHWLPFFGTLSMCVLIFLQATALWVVRRFLFIVGSNEGKTEMISALFCLQEQLCDWHRHTRSEISLDFVNQHAPTLANSGVFHVCSETKPYCRKRILLVLNCMNIASLNSADYLTYIHFKSARHRDKCIPEGNYRNTKILQDKKGLDRLFNLWTQLKGLAQVQQSPFKISIELSMPCLLFLFSTLVICLSRHFATLYHTWLHRACLLSLDYRWICWCFNRHSRLITSFSSSCHAIIGL